MTEAVVHFLEPVEVDIQRGRQRAPLEDRREHLEELLAIGDAGERVTPRLLRELLFERAALGDIGDEHDRAEVGAVVPTHGTGTDPRPNEPAVPRREPEIFVERFVAFVADARSRRLELIFADEIEERFAEELVDGGAEQIGERTVRERRAAVTVDHADAFAGELDDEAVPLLAFEQRALGSHAGRYVADVEDDAGERGIAEMVRADDLGFEPRPVRMAQTHEYRIRTRIRRAQRRGEPFERTDLINRVDEIERVRADDILRA